MRTTVFPGKRNFSLNGHGLSFLYGLLFAAAFVAALFFNGIRIEFFALSMALLVLLFFAILWRGYDHGMHIPATPMTITLTLFWAWLAITLLWSKVPYVSMVNFWWVGGAVFVFWLTTLAPARRHLFSGVYLAILAIGLVLALFGIYQQLHLDVKAQSTFLTRNSHAALMCLIVIPASSLFLQAHGSARTAVWTSRLLGPVLFTLYFSIALTSSRGVTLGLFMGLAVMVATVFRHVPRPRLVVFAAIVMAAYLIANISLKGEIADRLGTLMNLPSADPARFLIWERAWRMLMDEPWWGIGLGTYWLHWPPYRHPDDASGGFYAHNDYLQIWIETGLPGLLLLLAVYVAVLITFVRLVRHPRVSAAEIVTSAGLFGGLLAIAVHTFFDFDLYIYPIQLVMGLTLAQLHTMYLARVQAPVIAVAPARRMSRRAYRGIGLLVMLLPLFYFAALGGSAMLTYKARELVAQRKWVEASTAFSHAARLMPTSDLALIAHADMLRQALGQLPPGSGADRRTLYREALALLDDAEKANPLRSQLFFIRGLLYHQVPDLTGPDWADRAAHAYATALKRDPMAFWAREAYGGLLLWQGKLKLAKDVLEGGIDYRYTTGAVVGYYALLARARREAGEIGRAEALEKKISEMTGRPVKPLTGSLISLRQK